MSLTNVFLKYMPGDKRLVSVLEDYRDKINDIVGVVNGFGSSDSDSSGAKVPITRIIATTSPLAGGGNLSANRTLSIGYDTNDLELSSANLRLVNPINVKRYASFAAAVTAIGTTPATLYIPDEQAVAVDVVVPANVAVQFDPGGFLTIATTKTVTFYGGSIIAGVTKIFSCVGTGKVVFGGTYWNNTDLYPEWWGAKGDGATDDTTAIQAALTAASGYAKCGNIVHLLATQYVISATLLIDADTTLRGAGKKNRTVLYLKTGSNCDMIRNVGYDGIVGIEGIQIEDIMLNGNQAGQTSGSGISFMCVNEPVLRNIFIYDCKVDGFQAFQKWITGTGYTNGFFMDGVYVHGCGQHGFVFDNCIDFLLIHPAAVLNAGYGIIVNDTGAELYKCRAKLTMIQPTFEGNVTAGLYLASGMNCYILSPQFWYNAGEPFVIGMDYKNVIIQSPLFTGVVTANDIIIQANARGVYLLGGISTDRTNYTIAINDASNGKAFNVYPKTSHRARVYLSADQLNILNTTWTTVQLDTESYDIGSNFDTTLYKFVVPLTGYYEIIGQILWGGGLVVDKRFNVGVFNGATQILNGCQHASHTSSLIVQCRDILYLTAADVLYLKAYNDSGVDTCDVIAGQYNTTFLTVRLVTI